MQVGQDMHQERAKFFLIHTGNIYAGADDWGVVTPRPGRCRDDLAGAYSWPMTDATPPGPQAPAQPPAQPPADPAAETAPQGERIGTILMIGAIAVVAVLVIDVATKGRLLAPLFALLPAPKTAPTEGPPDATPRPAGD